MLKLYACPSLKELPYSVCKLRQLQFLDISLCGYLKQLPDKLGQLSSLKELDMRECSRVKQLPKSASDLRSLVHVICDYLSRPLPFPTSAWKLQKNTSIWICLKIDWFIIYRMALAGILSLCRSPEPRWKTGCLINRVTLEPWTLLVEIWKITKPQHNGAMRFTQQGAPGDQPYTVVRSDRNNLLCAWKTLSWGIETLSIGTKYNLLLYIIFLCLIMFAVHNMINFVQRPWTW